MRYWIGVASQDHIALCVGNGFSYQMLSPEVLLSNTNSVAHTSRNWLCSITNLLTMFN